MVIGTIIGASIFVQPSLVSGAVPSVPGMLLVWGAAGVLTLILAIPARIMLMGSQTWLSFVGWLAG
jgi:hypothetical protein